MKWKSIPSLRGFALRAMLCEDSPQSGSCSLTPCQALFASRRKVIESSAR